MPGRWPQTTVERGSRHPERSARGLHPYVLGQLLGRLHEFVPSSRLNPSSPATFPWTSMIRCAFLEFLLQASVLALQLAHFPLQRIPFARLSTSSLRQRSQPPTPHRLAPCRQVRRVQALPSEESTHLSGLRAPVRFFDDPQLIRRIEPAAQRLIYDLRVRRGCRASLSLPGSRGGTILFHSLSQSQHDRFLCLRPTLIL